MDTDEARQRLDEERRRLETVRDDLREQGVEGTSERDATSELSTVDQHPADVGTEMFDRERDLTILESIEAELEAVEDALRRLDEGTYGRCEACGRAIGDERLEAQPFARFCLEDQVLAERDTRAAIDDGS